MKKNQTTQQFITSYKIVSLMRLRDNKDHYRTILHQSSAIKIAGGGKDNKF